METTFSTRPILMMPRLLGFSTVFSSDTASSGERGGLVSVTRPSIRGTCLTITNPAADDSSSSTDSTLASLNFRTMLPFDLVTPGCVAAGAVAAGAVAAGAVAAGPVAVGAGAAGAGAAGAGAVGPGPVAG